MMHDMCYPVIKNVGLEMLNWLLWVGNGTQSRGAVDVGDFGSRRGEEPIEVLRRCKKHGGNWLKDGAFRALRQGGRGHTVDNDRAAGSHGCIDTAVVVGWNSGDGDGLFIVNENITDFDSSDLFGCAVSEENTMIVRGAQIGDGRIIECQRHESGGNFIVSV